MYIPSKGLSGYRKRGMGAPASGPLYTCQNGDQVFDSTNCPEIAAQFNDQGVANQGNAGDQVQAQIDALFRYLQPGQSPYAPIAGPAPTTFGGWISQNSSLVLGMSAGLIAVLLLGKLMR